MRAVFCVLLSRRFRRVFLAGPPAVAIGEFDGRGCLGWGDMRGGVARIARQPHAPPGVVVGVRDPSYPLDRYSGAGSAPAVSRLCALGRRVPPSDVRLGLLGPSSNSTRLARSYVQSWPRMLASASVWSMSVTLASKNHYTVEKNKENHRKQTQDRHASGRFDCVVEVVLGVRRGERAGSVVDLKSKQTCYARPRGRPDAIEGNSIQSIEYRRADEEP